MKKILIICLIICMSRISLPILASENIEDKSNSWRYKNGQVLNSKTKAFVPVFHKENGNILNENGDILLNASGIGVDVSQWQGKIDWETIKRNQEIDFVIIRCGFGGNDASYDDIYWKYNADECTRLGIPFGVYLYSYAQNNEDAKSEAEHVLRLVKGYNLSYPIYYDLEDNSIPLSSLLENTKMFSSILESKGYTVGIYSSLWWFNTYLTDPYFDNLDKWVAQWNIECTYEKPYSMWQYSNQGQVKGIDTLVDMNIDFNKKLENGWLFEENNWVYYENGNRIKGWFKEKSNWYYFDDNGYMLTGFQNIEGKTYYFASDGIMQTGWQKIENDTYFFCGDGNMYTGWLKQNNHYYYFIKNGAMLKGLNTVDGVSYYFDESGIMRTGWIKISNQYYYFNGSGAMVKNQWVGNYYLLSTGIMATNQWIGNYYVGADGAWIPNAPVTKWVKEGNNWKYLNTKTNTYSTSKWEKINNVWYYFNEESIMVTGLNTIEGKDYYFNTSGAMVTGWGKLNNKWYYFQASGAMAKSQWIQDYYLKENGEMATSEIVGMYYVDSTGAYVKNKWVLIGEDYYYFDGSGKMVKNKWIGDYYLGSDGKMARDTWIGVYYVDENGKWIPGKK